MKAQTRRQRADLKFFPGLSSLKNSIFHAHKKCQTAYCWHLFSTTTTKQHHEHRQKDNLVSVRCVCAPTVYLDSTTLCVAVVLLGECSRLSNLNHCVKYRLPLAFLRFANELMIVNSMTLCFAFLFFLHSRTHTHVQCKNERVFKCLCLFVAIYCAQKIR